MSLKQEQERELAGLSKTYSGNALNFAQQAEQARARGDVKAAEGFDYLAKFASSDASQAARESGQLAAGGKRDGVIPTLTIKKSGE